MTSWTKVEHMWKIRPLKLIVALINSIEVVLPWDFFDNQSDTNLQQKKKEKKLGFGTETRIGKKQIFCWKIFQALLL